VHTFLWSQVKTLHQIVWLPHSSFCPSAEQQKQGSLCQLLPQVCLNSPAPHAASSSLLPYEALSLQSPQALHIILLALSFGLPTLTSRAGRRLAWKVSALRPSLVTSCGQCVCNLSLCKNIRDANPFSLILCGQGSWTPSAGRSPTSSPWWSPSASWTWSSTALAPSWLPAHQEASSARNSQASPPTAFSAHQLPFLHRGKHPRTCVIRPCRAFTPLCLCSLTAAEDGPLAIDGGRHPVLERTQQGVDYVVRNFCTPAVTAVPLRYRARG